MSYKPAALNQEDTAVILEIMRKRVAANFGVTLVHDANGAYGKMGRWYLTLRFKNGRDHVEVTCDVRSVSSKAADEIARRLDAEDK